MGVNILGNLIRVVQPGEFNPRLSFGKTKIGKSRVARKTFAAERKFDNDNQS